MTRIYRSEGPIATHLEPEPDGGMTYGTLLETWFVTLHVVL